MRIDTQLPSIVRMGSELIEKLTHIEDGQIRSAMREIHDVLIHCLIEGQINKTSNAGKRIPSNYVWARSKNLLHLWRLAVGQRSMSRMIMPWQH